MRDEEGRSARERAFEYFNKGLRPHQLPDLGVKPKTILRYHESWKTLVRDRKTRAVDAVVRRTPTMQMQIAASFGLSTTEVAEAYAHRNSSAALQRLMRQHLRTRLESLGTASPDEIDLVVRLLRAYRGRDRMEFLLIFDTWIYPIVKNQTGRSDIVNAVLLAALALDDDLGELHDLRADLRQAFLPGNAPRRYNARAPRLP